MATKIVTKNSSTGGSAPSASDLVQGELAVNVTDKRLYTENASGAIVELGTKPSTIDINAGTIDGAAIGASSASTGAFTTLSASGDVNFDSGTLFVDASANKVGLGTVSPTGELHVKSASSNANFYLQRSVYDPWRLSAGAGYLAFLQDSSEKMRLSGGNLLVGKTTTAIGTQGIRLEGSNGKIEATRSGNVVTTFNRTSSDGPISEWMKDGTTVGSIGVEAGDNFYIADAATNTGLNFKGFINPCDSSGASSRDNFDLGHSTQGRLRNLYLGGGVYLGGTGAANKLDQYEQGNWVPVTKSGSTTITTAVNNAKYVKIGALVYVTAFVTRNDGASLTGNISIHGLPFQVASGSAQVNGTIWFDTTTTDEVATNYFVASTSLFQPKKVGASGDYVAADKFQNGRPYYMSGVYMVAI